MRVFVTCDMDWQTKMDHAIRGLEVSRGFERKNFGAGLAGISITLNARDPELKHRRRERFRKEEKVIG